MLIVRRKIGAMLLYLFAYINTHWDRRTFEGELQIRY